MFATRSWRTVRQSLLFLGKHKTKGTYSAISGVRLCGRPLFTMWAWMGLALNVRAYTKKQAGDDGDVSSGTQRKMILQLAEKRLTLAQQQMA